METARSAERAREPGGGSSRGTMMLVRRGQGMGGGEDKPKMHVVAGLPSSHEDDAADEAPVSHFRSAQFPGSEGAAGEPSALSWLDLEDGMEEAKAKGMKYFIGWLYVKYWTAWNIKITSHKTFNNSITMVIFLASIVVGIQTYESMEENSVLEVLDMIILWIFTYEVLAKVWACGLQPWAYFYDRWNQFDFVVVFVCYMPLDASMVTVLRLFRLLRVLKLVRALPELQVLVMGLLNSLSSIFYVALLLMLVFYLYAVLCISLFRDNDPVHFPNLETTFLTLFRMATFEDWTDVMYIQMYGCDEYGYGFRQFLCTDPQAFGWFPAVFFITFVVLSSFVVLNLFIGVITSNMQDARDLLKHDQPDEDEANKMSDEEKRCQDVSNDILSLLDNVGTLQDQLNALQGDVSTIMEKFKAQHRAQANKAAKPYKQAESSPPADE